MAVTITETGTRRRAETGASASRPERRRRGSCAEPGAGPATPGGPQV